MRQQAVTWFHGWKITLKCTGFGCQDGTRRFASSASLQYVPIQSNPSSLHCSGTQRDSRVHTEDAFWTCEEANTDALERARQKIFELDGPQSSCGKKIKEITRDTGTGQESDETLAARFEITFDGKRYTFRQYNYDRFEDALRYAAAEHAKQGFVQDKAFESRWPAAYHPPQEDKAIMLLHRITYVGGHYLYGGYRYSKLSDALAFAAGHPNL